MYIILFSILVKRLFLFFFLVNVNQIFAQQIFQKDKPSKFIYILARGTKSKQNFIGKNFNISDTNITHIGIGLYNTKEKKIKIYNPVPKKRGAFVIDSFASFLAQPDLFYSGVWKCKLKRKERAKASALIHKFNNSLLRFDFSFLINGLDNEYYCSEFTWIFLTALNPKKFAFAPISRKIKDESIRLALNRDTLTYIPVDFFLQFRCFKKQKERLIK